MSPQLVALLAAIAYALGVIVARRGLSYTTPVTVTVVSLAVQAVTLWTAILLSGGFPEIVPTAVSLIVIAGVLQAAIRLLTYVGVDRIGAARSVPLRSTHPLWSGILAITVLGEEPTLGVVAGTLLVVAGIPFLSWQPGEEASTQHWWHALYSLGAAILAGIAYPIRRYALILSNQPLFFGAVVGPVALACLSLYLSLPTTTERTRWSRKSLWPLLAAGGLETLGLFLVLYALSFGPVLLVSPILATLPLWTLLGTVVFLRDLERLTARTILGAVCVVAGTAAIYLAD